MKASSVITLTAERLDVGRSLASRLSLPHLDASGLRLVKPGEIVPYLHSHFEWGESIVRFVFLYREDGLSLAQIDADRFLSIRADFHGGTVRYRREKGGGKGQMIAKAVGLGGGRPPSVLDATAGLGRDAFVLASLGCPLVMAERVPEVRALLADGLAQARERGAAEDPELLPILDRMRLVESDAMTHMSSLRRGVTCEARRNPALASGRADWADDAPDVIYLDPMFPPRSKSAEVKKEMRVFHALVGADPDAAELLPAAIGCARKRVVVKRPRLAPTLGTEKPSHTLEGKSNRFDVYVCR